MRTFLLLALSLLLILLAACSGTPQFPRDANGNVLGTAAVDAVSVQVEEGPLPHKIIITAQGTLPDDCTRLAAVTLPPDTEHLTITLATLRPADQHCKKQKQPFSKKIVWEAQGLRGGEHVVSVNGVQAHFLLEADNVAPTPTPTPTPLPPVLLPAIDPPTATPSATGPVAATPAPDSATCSNRVTFVDDITVPDKTKIDAGARFTKTWRLRNSGTCTWTPDYTLIFAKDDPMDGPKSQPLGATVKPGKTVDISVALTAPKRKGSYISQWLLQTPAGQKFGLGDDGKTPFWLKIRVPKDAPSPQDAVGSISGMVWHDLCAANLATADTLPPGCEIAPQGGVMADGIHQAQEPAIVDAEIALGAGTCPSSGLSTVKSGHDGHFTFKNLKAGTYCLSIDASSDYNRYIFIPGQWTTPAQGQMTIELGPGETKTQLDFGWDYELAP